MKKENFFPKVTINDNQLILNAEAIETMDLDIKDPKVLLVETTNPNKEGRKDFKEVLLIKVNNSLCDDPENIKESFNPDLIKTVSIEYEEDMPILGTITVPKESLEAITSDMGKDNREFKLLCYNNENALQKELKDQFDIKNSYYKLAYLNDKRMNIGKEKTKDTTEERVKIS